MASVINFGVLHPDGKAWVNAVLHFELSDDDFTDTEQFPSEVVKATKTDSSGNGSISLWENEGGKVSPQTFFKCTLPSGETFPFTVPTAGAPFELGTLRTDYVTP